MISQVPFPPRAAAGENDGSDKVSPAELHGISLPVGLVCRSQEGERGEGQQRAPHSAALRGGVGREEAVCEAEVGSAAEIPAFIRLLRALGWIMARSEGDDVCPKQVNRLFLVAI